MDALRAFEIVQRTFPEARLALIGSGPEAERLREYAARIEGVDILGHVSHAERDEQVAKAHALVATSVREGWGLVVSEAAALGTAAIAYDVPGLRDSITATGGELVPARIDDLAAAMLRVARDPLGVPAPTSTGTVPFAEVADLLLERVGVTADA
jgi:glycosyltransferase involved in cell wall biosynthesis